MVEGLGNGYYRLVKAFVHGVGDIGGQFIGRFEKLIRLDVQSRRKLNQRLRGNPAIAVLDIAQEVDRNIEPFS